MLQKYTLYRLEVPAGRVIGDCGCHYEKFAVLALSLTDEQGLTGWGYGVTVSDGVYTRPAPWRQPLAGEKELCADFDSNYWPWLISISCEVSLNRARVRAAGYCPLNQALHMALWDLQARQHGIPLHRLLGGDGTRLQIRAYGSALDFHLNDFHSMAAHVSFASRGFTAVKVKIGSPDAGRDLSRLLHVREAVGPTVEISVDANEGWTCEEAVRRIETFEREGLNLIYVEDPLPLSDVKGYERLSRSVRTEIIGQDYATNAAQLRTLLEVGALSRLRVAGTLDHIMACGALAKEFELPVIVGNSIFETNIHVAAALPAVERLEFSDLAWNRLVAHPVRFEKGNALVPDRPGHGLELHPEAFVEYRHPEPSN